MKRTGQLAMVAILTAMAAGAAEAQLLGIPYYPTPTGTGVSASADYGNPDGPGSAVGLTGGIGFGRFGITAGAGRVDFGGPGSNTEITLGATAGMKLFGGGLNPLSVGAQVGAGTVSIGGARQTWFMPGVNVALSPPLFPLKPFGVAYYTMGDAQEELHLSVGANFNLLLGLGFHAAYDWADEAGATWGVGAHFNFRLPGLPGM